ncbi:MAG: hypothetical protein KGJ53_04690 [Alphaproteobacteria bacterium]|nr:hypothetical protein [Alphaproteobacteria bacterium]
MSHAGWGALWNQTLALLGAESIQIRILVGLGVAFVALMIVEGLRVSFLPAARKRRAARAPAASMPSETKAARKAAGTGTQSFEAAPFRPRGKTWASSPKRAKGPVSRHRAERPKIRRIPGNSLQNSPVSMPSFTEEAVPYTPLPPNPG